MTSFLGGIALGEDGPTGLAWLAILLFLAATAAVAFVLAPRRQWYFRSKPSMIIGGYVQDDPPAPLWAIYKQLAEHLETDFTANQSNMKPLFWAVHFANLALASEVIVGCSYSSGGSSCHPSRRTHPRSLPRRRHLNHHGPTQAPPRNATCGRRQ